MAQANRPPHDEVIPILDFGAQYAQLIARRVREAGAYSMLVRPDISVAELRALNPRGIILSGGPASVHEEGAPTCDPGVFELGVPVLGICYGMQLACQALGCRVAPAREREFGHARLDIHDAADLFKGIPSRTAVWMSHGDQVHNLADHFDLLASTPTCQYAAVRHKRLPVFGVQFHPEVTHTPHGVDIFRNFLYEICKCRGTWRMADFLKTECQRVRQIVGKDRVICGLSGGVDSSVVAALLHQAIGDQLTCIFVDNGLLRKKERDLVEATFRDHFDIDLRVVDAAEQFLSDLAGITDPQEKRRRIGHRFIEVFKQAVARLSEPWTFLRLCEPEQQPVARHSEPYPPDKTSVPESIVAEEAIPMPVAASSPDINRQIINLPEAAPRETLFIDSFVGRDPFPKGESSPPDLMGFIRNLPHYELPGATYFVTWKLDDESEPLTEAERDIVLAALMHWHGVRMELYAATVMSNHVHCLVRPLAEWRLGDIIGGVKKFTAREINRRRNQNGPLWQEERFDHIVRDEAWLTEFLYYILRNPVKAGACTLPSEYRWTVVHPRFRTAAGLCVSKVLAGQRPAKPDTGQRPVPPVRFLAQGTLYPDVIESGHGHAGISANIKLHHNVGGLPEDLGFELIEPLRDLFKDEVRQLGEVLGLPAQIVWRHPFPGPGLAVRVLGEVTRARLDILRDCDEILLEEIVANNLYRSTDQVFAVLLPIQSVGVMGDGRTYDSVVAIRAVTTQDFMTADWARLPFQVLATISNRIINEVKGVNRVVYDISSKPPATIEWE